MNMAYYKRPDDGMNAVQRYQAKCDAITIRPMKEEGDRIRAAASARGFDSLTKFIVSAINEYIERHPVKQSDAEQ